VATTWVAAGCSVPIGPAFLIEKQRIEVIYSRSAPDRVIVQAWFRIKNTGPTPIEGVRFRIPLHNFIEKMHIEWNGAPIGPDNPAPKGADNSSRLVTPLQMRTRAELTITYDLPIVAKSASPTFSLSAPEWYPTLLPPEGALAQAGGPPNKWDLVVTVPSDFRVHASGIGRGRERSAGANGGSVSLRFEQRQGVDFDPFVVTGQYAEHQFSASSESIFLWASHPLPVDRVRILGERYGAATAYFTSEFGLKDATHRQVWVIECSEAPSIKFNLAWGLPVPRSGALFSDPTECFTQPQAAYMTSMDEDPSSGTGLFVGQMGSGPSLGEESVEVQLAATWFYFGLHEDLNGPWFPMGGAPEYAALSFAIFNNSASRKDSIKLLIEESDTLSSGNKDALSAVDDSVGTRASSKDLELARIRSELFFLALEDRCGEANVHRALARIVRDLRGQTWGVSDLRSAMEAECGGDLADFFREWLLRPGIPDSFRARYMGAPGAKPAG
jgi:hypothetical protein